MEEKELSTLFLGRNARLYKDGVVIGYGKNISVKASAELIKEYRMAAFLRCLKETFADPGEVLGLNWKALSGNVITINKPVKGHLPGQVKISPELAGMLNNLPKNSTQIFPTSYNCLAHCFRILRNATARRLQNPKILHVTFKNFRHWGGSMLAYITSGNVLAVKKALRHKQIANTMKYIHRLSSKTQKAST